MNNKDVVRKMIEQMDNFEGDFDFDDNNIGLRKMKDIREKLKKIRVKRQKPEWKDPNKKEEADE